MAPQVVDPNIKQPPVINESAASTPKKEGCSSRVSEITFLAIGFIALGAGALIILRVQGFDLGPVNAIGQVGATAGYLFVATGTCITFTSILLLVNPKKLVQESTSPVVTPEDNVTPPEETEVKKPPKLESQLEVKPEGTSTNVHPGGVIGELESKQDKALAENPDCQGQVALLMKGVQLQEDECVTFNFEHYKTPFYCIVLRTNDNDKPQTFYFSSRPQVTLDNFVYNSNFRDRVWGLERDLDNLPHHLGKNELYCFAYCLFCLISKAENGKLSMNLFSTKDELVQAAKSLCGNHSFVDKTNELDNDVIIEDLDKDTALSYKFFKVHQYKITKSYTWGQDNENKKLVHLIQFENGECQKLLYKTSSSMIDKESTLLDPNGYILIDSATIDTFLEAQLDAAKNESGVSKTEGSTPPVTDPSVDNSSDNGASKTEEPKPAETTPNANTSSNSGSGSSKTEETKPVAPPSVDDAAKNESGASKTEESKSVETTPNASTSSNSGSGSSKAEEPKPATPPSVDDSSNNGSGASQIEGTKPTVVAESTSGPKGSITPSAAQEQQAKCILDKLNIQQGTKVVVNGRYFNEPFYAVVINESGKLETTYFSNGKDAKSFSETSALPTSVHESYDKYRVSLAHRKLIKHDIKSDELCSYKLNNTFFIFAKENNVIRCTYYPSKNELEEAIKGNRSKDLAVGVFSADIEKISAKVLAELLQTEIFKFLTKKDYISLSVGDKFILLQKYSNGNTRAAYYHYPSIIKITTSEFNYRDVTSNWLNTPLTKDETNAFHKFLKNNKTSIQPEVDSLTEFQVNEDKLTDGSYVLFSFGMSEFEAVVIKGNLDDKFKGDHVVSEGDVHYFYFKTQASREKFIAGTALTEQSSMTSSGWVKVPAQQ